MKKNKAVIEIVGFCGSLADPLPVKKVVAFATKPGTNDVLVYPNLKGDFSLVAERETLDTLLSMKRCEKIMAKYGYSLKKMENDKGWTFSVVTEAVDKMPKGFSVCKPK